MNAGKWICMLALLLGASSCGISGGTGPSDPSPKSDLEIRDVLVAPSDTSALISWNTTQQTVGTLQFGHSQTSLSSSRSSNLSGTHAVTLAPLDPDTEYWFQITAATPLGPRTAIRPVSFRTLTPMDLSDTTAPVISDIQVVGITAESATITWRTDDRSRGTTYYGESTAYGQSAAETDPTRYLRSHAVTLTGLSEATDYHFLIQAVNRAGRARQSADQVFRSGERPFLEITPDTVRVGGNVEFTFRVSIRNVSNLAAMSFRLQWDPQFMEILSATPGSFWSEHDGLIPLLIEKEDSDQGFIEYAMSWRILFQNGTAVGTLANGGGDVAMIRARAKGDGTSSFLRLIESADGLASTRLLDHNRRSMQFGIRDGVVIKQVH
jgi:hypothetical protein